MPIDLSQFLQETPTSSATKKVVFFILSVFSTLLLWSMSGTLSPLFLLVLFAGGIVGGTVFSAFLQTSKYISIAYPFVFFLIGQMLPISGLWQWTFLALGISLSVLFLELHTDLSERIHISFLSVVPRALSKSFFAFLFLFSFIIASFIPLSDLLETAFQSNMFGDLLSKVTTQAVSSPALQKSLDEQKGEILKVCAKNAECIKKTNADFEAQVSEAKKSSSALAKDQIKSTLSPEALQAQITSLPYGAAISPESAGAAVVFLLVFLLGLPFIPAFSFFIAVFLYPLFTILRLLQVFVLRTRSVQQEYFW
ncbi:MAG: hypothetical protein WCJ84_01250 [Candidatus Peregrinibacteria bacterium]